MGSSKVNQCATMTTGDINVFSFRNFCFFFGLFNSSWWINKVVLRYQNPNSMLTAADSSLCKNKKKLTHTTGFTLHASGFALQRQQGERRPVGRSERLQNLTELLGRHLKGCPNDATVHQAKRNDEKPVWMTNAKIGGSHIPSSKVGTSVIYCSVCRH